MNPIIRDIARALVILVLLLMFISGVAQLAGCNVTRATAAAPAASPSTAQQPIDCGTWVDCARAPARICCSARAAGGT